MAPTFKHILVPTDFSDAARHAQEVALGLARMFDAKVTLLNACVLPPIPYGNGFTLPLDAIVEAAQKEMDAEQAAAQKEYPNVTGIVSTSSASDAILSTAKELGADLIVMGTQGRRGVARWVLGSVAENIVRAAEVPVMTVSAKAAA